MKYLRYILLLALVAFSEVCRADTQLPFVINSSLTYISNDGSGVGEMSSGNGLIITNDGTLLFQDKIDSDLNTYLNVNPGGLISLSNFGKVFLYSSIGNQAVLNMNGNKLYPSERCVWFEGGDRIMMLKSNGTFGDDYVTQSSSKLIRLRKLVLHAMDYCLRLRGSRVELSDLNDSLKQYLMFDRR